MTIRVSVPSTAKVDEIIEVKALIRHDMESGFRRDEYGRAIPRDIIKHFECLYNGESVFRAEFFPAVSANPFLRFHTVATESGELEFRWVDQHGETQSHTAEITVL